MIDNNRNDDYLKKIYNIKQVSLLLQEKQSKIRYWLKRFPLLNFKKFENGRCFFHFDDILILLNIQYYLNEASFKIEGVQKYIKKIGIREFKEQAKKNYKYQNIIDNAKNNILINKNLKDNNVTISPNTDTKNNPHKITTLQTHSINNIKDSHLKNTLQPHENLQGIMEEIQELERLFKSKS